MARRPRVGVSGHGRRWAPSWWCTSLALRVLGARPLRLSVRHELEPDSLDALIIGGGDDIGAEQYGGVSDAKVKTDPARDALELRWIGIALDREIPLLGICRGAQLINVAQGGTLHSDIGPLREHTHNRPGLLATKLVALEEGSLLAQVCARRRIRVNSLHHQAIDEPGRALRITARDRDGICQGIESQSERRILGVQWHPEYLAYLPVQLRLFRWLLAKAELEHTAVA